MTRATIVTAFISLIIDIAVCIYVGIQWKAQGCTDGAIAVMVFFYQIGTIGVYRFIRFIVRLLCWLDHKEDPYDYEEEYMD